jgi:hypothetical protein
MVAPGRYAVRLTAGVHSETRSFEVKVDPRVTADGVSQADLIEQEHFLRRIGDAIDSARQVQARVEEAMRKAGVSKPGPLAAGERPFDSPQDAKGRYASPLQALWARLVSAPEPYPQRMLIDQLAYLERMLAQADQKVGQDAYRRYDDLMKELGAISAEAMRVLGTASGQGARGGQ